MNDTIKLYSWRAGDILMFHTKHSPFAWAIRKVTNSYFNHTALIIDSIHLVEALGNGVVRNSIMDYILNKQYDLCLIRLKDNAFKNTSEQLSAIAIAIKRANESIGKKYDWGAIAGLAIKYWLRAINKFFWLDKFFAKVNIFQNRYQFFCSELVAMAYDNTSSIYPYSNLFAGRKSIDVSVTTPKDIKKADSVEFIAGTNKE